MKRQRRQSGEPTKSQPTPYTVEVARLTTIPFAQRLTCTINEACEVTGLGRTKLYELIGAERLETTTIGRRRLVVVRSLLSLLESSAST